MKRDAIIILAPGFAASECDSTCLPPQQVLIRAQIKKYPSVQFIVLAFQYPFVKKRYSWYGAEVISFNGSNKGNIKRLLLWRNVWNQLRILLYEFEVKGIFSFWLGECALVGEYFGRRYNIDHYCWILGRDANKKNRYIKMIRPSAERLVAVSDFISDQMVINHGIKPGHIIPIGVDTGMFDHVEEKVIDIMGAGSLIPLKKFEVFIDVVQELKQSVPGIRAVICGDGIMKESLQGLIINSGLSENIELKGEVSHQEVINLMQRSKIFLHPSSYEGFGSVCIEALYAGCHVISFCKPMHAGINHWHIVRSQAEMVGTALEILMDPEVDHQPVLFCEAEQVGREVMGLLGF